MPQIPSTPNHCPGFDTLRDLKSFVCRCPNCGEAKEIFSDEFNRSHKCSKCGQLIDFTKCSIEGQAGDPTPR